MPAPEKIYRITYRCSECNQEYPETHLVWEWKDSRCWKADGGTRIVCLDCVRASVLEQRDRFDSKDRSK